MNCWPQWIITIANAQNVIHNILLSSLYTPKLCPNYSSRRDLRQPLELEGIEVIELQTSWDHNDGSDSS
jgi:hypothetical protein